MQKLFYFCLKVWYKDISMIVWKAWQQKHEVAGNIASQSVDKSQCPLTLSFESSVCSQTMGTTRFILWIQSMPSAHGVPLTLSYEFSLMVTHIQGDLPSSLEYRWKFCHPHTHICVSTREGIVSPVKFTMETTNASQRFSWAFLSTFRLP